MYAYPMVVYVFVILSLSHLSYRTRSIGSIHGFPNVCSLRIKVIRAQFWSWLTGLLQWPGEPSTLYCIFVWWQPAKPNVNHRAKQNINKNIGLSKYENGSWIQNGDRIFMEKIKKKKQNGGLIQNSGNLVKIYYELVTFLTKQILNYVNIKSFQWKKNLINVA
jgi:hypothetical protein